MKNKAVYKYLFDITMTVLMLLLMDYDVTGLALHEWLGIGLFVMFAAHKLFNYKWIKGVSARLFDSGLKTKTRIMYLLDVLLLFSVSAVTVSGILVSELFSFELGDRAFWVSLHELTAYGSLILISVHIGFHWKAIMKAAGKMAGIKQPNTARTWALRACALLLARRWQTRRYCRVHVFCPRD